MKPIQYVKSVLSSVIRDMTSRKVILVKRPRPVVIVEMECFQTARNSTQIIHSKVKLITQNGMDVR